MWIRLALLQNWQLSWRSWMQACLGPTTTLKRPWLLFIFCVLWSVYYGSLCLIVHTILASFRIHQKQFVTGFLFQLQIRFHFTEAVSINTWRSMLYHRHNYNHTCKIKSAYILYLHAFQSSRVSQRTKTKV